MNDYIIGFKNKYYTLWRKHQNRYKYIRNLSTNKEEAIIKAGTNEINYNLKRRKVFTKFNKYDNISLSTIIDFGKYKGMSIKDLLVKDFNYCLWLSKNTYKTGLKRFLITIPEISKFI